ncbi:hypothetical protein CKAH01_04774 [Colletotrichum kahawae]|uniref:Uncharacterized protein n=1 Tax=Colletotrichum kahawae TaxID=34407 RepID=A0AAD9YIV9_COLKA|nr:hypothetical protein CKAH01_04774 [Colletotrichum kahawae]
MEIERNCQMPKSIDPNQATGTSPRPRRSHGQPCHP